MSWLGLNLGPHGILGQYGYAGIFAVVFLESVGLPLPGETTLILASGLAAQGTFEPALVWATAASAAMVGDNIAYLIGKTGGHSLVLHHGRRVGITHQRLGQAEKIMSKRGWFVVFVARFFPLLRELNGLAAGTTQMRWRTFLIANALGAIVWAGIWTYFGDWLGMHLTLMAWVWHHLGPVSIVVIPVLAIVAFAVIRRWHNVKQEKP